MSAKPDDISSSSSDHALLAVRYSLPDLLAELKHERLTGALSMEKLHQTEIGKLFQTQPKRRRAKPNR